MCVCVCVCVCVYIYKDKTTGPTSSNSILVMEEGRVAAVDCGQVQYL